MGSAGDAGPQYGVVIGASCIALVGSIYLCWLGFTRRGKAAIGRMRPGPTAVTIGTPDPETAHTMALWASRLAGAIGVAGALTGVIAGAVLLARS